MLTVATGLVYISLMLSLLKYAQRNKKLQPLNQVKLNITEETERFCPAIFITKLSKNSLQFVCLSVSLLMYRMLSVDNLFRNIATFNSILILLNLEKDLSPEQLVTIKLRNKASRGWIN